MGYIVPIYIDGVHSIERDAAMFITNWINKWRLTEQINDIRAGNGLDLLLRVRFLDKIAWQHARYMAKNDKLGHDGFQTRALLVREKKKRFDSRYVGENCGKCPGRTFNMDVVRTTTDGWMKSASHRNAILNPEYQKTGIGCITNQGYVYIVQIFVG
jgi:uncharacterized protein YkwD